MATTHTPETPETNRLTPGRQRPFLLTGEGWPYLLVPLIPVAIFLELLHAGAVPIFIASAVGVIPTAALMGRATEDWPLGTVRRIWPRLWRRQNRRC